MLILFVAVSTHFKQTKSFLNSHVFRTSKTITTAALSDSSESSEISETGHDDSGGSSLTAPIRNASRQKEALSRHNSSTVESADSILEETN